MMVGRQSWFMIPLCFVLGGGRWTKFFVSRIHEASLGNAKEDHLLDVFLSPARLKGFSMFEFLAKEEDMQTCH